MRANTPRSRSEPLRLVWELFGLSDAARTVCVLFGGRMPGQRRRKRRFGAGVRTRRFHSCRTSNRIRHQPECTWNQTLTNPCAPVSEAGNSGDEPGGCRTCSGMAGRSNGGTNSADPVFHPNSGDLTGTIQTLARPPWFRQRRSPGRWHAVARAEVVPRSSRRSPDLRPCAECRDAASDLLGLSRQSARWRLKSCPMIPLRCNHFFQEAQCVHAVHFDADGTVSQPPLDQMTACTSILQITVCSPFPVNIRGEISGHDATPDGGASDRQDTGHIWHRSSTRPSHYSQSMESRIPLWKSREANRN